MKTKKSGVYAALAAVLLITAVLVTTCVDPSFTNNSTSNTPNDRGSFTPPPGKGYIRLNLGVEKFSQAARTSMPTVEYSVWGDFDGGVDIDFIADGDPLNNETVAGWNGTTVIPLTPDTYDIKVTGKANGGVVVGYGEALSVLVSAGAGGADANIVIKEIVDGVGTGTFNWTFTNTGAVTSATLNIVGLSSGAQTDYDNINWELVSGGVKSLSDTLTLDSGYYRLTLDLVKAGHANATVREIVHIWQGHITSFSKVLSLNSNVHTVRYYYNDERDPAEPPNPALYTEEQFTHGDFLTNPSAGVPVHLDEDNIATGIRFVGWYTDDGSTDWGTQWAVGTTYVIRPQYLYAKWGGLTVTIGYTTNPTIIFAFTGSKTGTIDPDNYEMDQNDPEIITITASTTATLDTPTYQWYHNGVAIASATSTTLVIDYTTVGSATIPYLIPGIHEFSLWISEDGMEKYDEGFEIEVTY